jgi:hypothetical protein
MLLVVILAARAAILIHDEEPKTIGDRGLVTAGGSTVR